MTTPQTATPHADRDGWTTPLWLTELLAPVSLDPCSNSRSTVRAGRTYTLDRGEDGLALPWCGTVFCNPPYSNVLPWARRLESVYGSAVTSAAFLVNCDPSTRWWRVLCGLLPFRLDFDRRIRFTPPPGVQPSSNSKPQSLLCDEAFWARCSPALATHGVLWRRL
jgi:hypothetical protein